MCSDTFVYVVFEVQVTVNEIYVSKCISKGSSDELLSAKLCDTGCRCQKATYAHNE